MNYRDFFKNKKATAKDIQNLIPEGVDQKEFNTGIETEKEHTDDEFTAAKIAGDHLKEDPKYYSKLKSAGLEESGWYDADGVKYSSSELEGDDEVGVHPHTNLDPNRYGPSAGDFARDEMDKDWKKRNPGKDLEEEGCCEEHFGMEDSGNEYDENGGLPKVGGALAIPHVGQPIMMGKIIQVGGLAGKPATGELSGMTTANSKGVAKDGGGLKVEPQNDTEPILAGGKTLDASIASKSVGGSVVPGEGQKQGGKNTQGTIASTSKLNEHKQKILRAAKEVLKEIRYNKTTGKWEKINEGMADMKMGPSYKVVQPRQYKTVEDMPCRKNQYEPEIQEMYDDEEECMMNERYVELANAQRNLSESELSELKTLREKIDRISENNWIQKAVKHPGRCAHPGDKNCPKGSPQYNLAMRFKKGDIHKANVSEMDDFGDTEDGERSSHDIASSETNPNDYKKCNGCGKQNYLCDCPSKHGEEGDFGHDGFQRGKLDIDEGRCEDYPCCGHEEGGCPNEDGSFNCAGCGARLPKNSHSSLCRSCLRRAESGDEYGGHDGGYGEYDESVDMKMGPSYKKVQPRQYKTMDDDFPRTNQYDPQIQEAGGGAVQHSSYRTVAHGNLPQNPKQRWENDIDEGQSKVAKTIAKGQKGKTSTKVQSLKHKNPKKTSTGVHKRKR